MAADERRWEGFCSSLNMMMSAFNLTNTVHFNDPSGSFTGRWGRSRRRIRNVRFGWKRGWNSKCMAANELRLTPMGRLLS
jgi:hypothetical protein